MKREVEVHGSTHEKEYTFVVHDRDRKVGRKMLVYQKKQKMEAPLVVGEMNWQ
jgi:hypothetical protein